MSDSRLISLEIPRCKGNPTKLDFRLKDSILVWKFLGWRLAALCSRSLAGEETATATASTASCWELCVSEGWHAVGPVVNFSPFKSKAYHWMLTCAFLTLPTTWMHGCMCGCLQ